MSFGNYSKKKTKVYAEQDQKKVAAYKKEISDINREKIVYIDETGFDSYLSREYGRSKRGTKITGLVSGRKFRRTSLVAAKVRKEIIAPLQYDGTMNGSLFEFWFQHMLLPALPENSVIVMDNASFHRKTRLFSLIEETSHRIIFLPPYSPELNPIEKFWGWLKPAYGRQAPLAENPSRICFI
jgi:transposase